MQTNKEEILWRLFLEGNADAFSAIFKLYYSPLHNYGLKICNNTQATEDCLQNFFIYLYEHRKGIKEVKSVKSYLFISFRRSLLTYLKKERTYTDIESVKAKSLNFEFSAEELRINQEFTTAKKETVTKILNTLSTREREVIYLKYYSKLSTSDIATTMSITYQSVSNTLQKAFTKLRNNIENNMLAAVLKK
ncbi:sigma-70 family RNA polymerase sigma factor [Cellulophaga baltica]|uniref:RNA polymerase sigma factor n=1 Tax=Cellulophaga TaxID=104264 RepID=UPI001C07B2C0|nr:MULTISPECIES: sigma-70 family RNA polymerase sigma factor [Cellulophaga]MBU2996173.1 sigma-70 family RNA polymerase sigma factor [Cellulophaga baltica]MDO6767568.1 sigma-70 family RNA polymerase sigma factor [Cellulophaga sp. 1_MG-2023]